MFRRDDAGSMPIALLITLVGVTLSGSLTTLVVGQLRDSRRAADRTAAVAVAQAGLDSALATIRSAVTRQAGDIAKLPCTTLTGRLPALAGTGPGTPAYSVSIGYFLVDPSAFVDSIAPLGDLTRLTNAVTSVPNLLAGVGQSGGTTPLSTALNRAITCVNGVLTQVPVYGLLRSSGTVGSVTRTLYATYTFSNVDQTIPGGHVVIAGTDAAPLCLGDTNPEPAEGDLVSAVPCTSPAMQAKLIYPKNLSLALTDTRTTAASRDSTAPAYPYGLCVTATGQADGSAVRFMQCSPTTSVDQQWDYEVNAQTYYGAVAAVSGGQPTVVRSGFCLNMQTPSTLAGGPIVMRTGSNCGRTNASGRAFVPDALVGAGGAGPASGQFVNKGEVGRCLDLTNETPDGSWAKKGQPVGLISYPCKQALAGSVFWNHKWAGPLTVAMTRAGVTSAQGTVSATDPRTGQDWCMRSPGADGGYVWVAKCTATDPALRWTVNGATPSVTDAYQVTDRYGHCLEAAQKRGPAYVFSTSYNIIVSYVIATTCTGADEQKWNAPTNLPLGPLKGIQER